MKKLILNEKKYVEDSIINSSILPSDVSANMAIGYLTKYYYEKNCSLEDIIDIVCKKMNEFNLDVLLYQDYKAVSRIKKYYNALESNKLDKLRDNNNIPLYQSEYDNIMQCDNDKEKKVLFTLYILGRFTNRYGWVYQSETDIYKLANVSTTVQNRNDIFASLLSKGFIKDTKKVNDLKVGVNLSNGINDDIVLSVDKLEYLGNQLMAFIKPGYKVCENCGRLIKIKGNRQKYCEKCYEKINCKMTNERQKQQRNG